MLPTREAVTVGEDFLLPLLSRRSSNVPSPELLLDSTVDPVAFIEEATELDLLHEDVSLAAGDTNGGGFN